MDVHMHRFAYQPVVQAAANTSHLRFDSMKWQLTGLTLFLSLSVACVRATWIKKRNALTCVQSLSFSSRHSRLISSGKWTVFSFDVAACRPLKKKMNRVPPMTWPFKRQEFRCPPICLIHRRCPTGTRKCPNPNKSSTTTTTIRTRMAKNVPPTEPCRTSCKPASEPYVARKREIAIRSSRPSSSSASERMTNSRGFSAHVCPVD